MKRIIPFIVVIIIAGIPAYSFSAQKFSYGAWVPYWKKTGAIPELMQHIDTIKEVSPFSYEVQTNGTLRDAMKLQDESWLGLMELAGSKGIKIIPTISWMDGDQIHIRLSSSTLRVAHEKNILKLVDTNDFDGIDIDYENKKAETKSSFSLFLKELSKELHTRKKTLSCTIEARTPTASRFKVVPKDLEYANDFKAINSYCDEVRLMAYGQGRIDLLLNKKKDTKGYYMPIADKEWVEKVIVEMGKTVTKSKIMLGVPNFGYEYEATSASSTVYKKIGSLEYNDVIALASSTGKTIMRNAAGEAGFSYATSSLPSATSTPVAVTRFVVVSDAQAIQDKVTLAKKYKLKGVMLFRVDGESDPKMWSVLK